MEIETKEPDANSKPTSYDSLVQAGELLRKGVATVTSSSWTSSDDGMADLEEALKLQLEAYGRDDHSELAATYYWLGRALAKQSLYEGSQAHYLSALVLLETSVGRYHRTTGDVYVALASIYIDQGMYSKAFRASLAALRIQHRLYGHYVGPWKGPILLKEVGLSLEFISEVELWLMKSMEQENAGDALLDRQDYYGALAAYEGAAQIEKDKFGVRNANLALVQRKIATLDFVPSDHMPTFSLDWDEYCRPTSRVVVCTSIQNGDKLYLEGKYEAAVSAYRTVPARGSFAEASGPESTLYGGISTFSITFAAMVVVVRACRWLTARLVSQGDDPNSFEMRCMAALCQLATTCVASLPGQAPEPKESTESEGTFNENEFKVSGLEAIEAKQEPTDNLILPSEEDLADSLILPLERGPMAASLEHLGAALARELVSQSEDYRFEQEKATLIGSSLRRPGAEDVDETTTWSFPPHVSIHLE